MAKRARRLSPERSSASSSSVVVAAASGGGDTVVDRLIGLPEPLRNHILNLLPLKYAIRTGALNKRWRGLWSKRWPHRATFNLVHPPGTDLTPFVIMVDYLLRYCITNHRLDFLRLVFYPGPEPLLHLKLWLDHATNSGVEFLLLDFTPPPPPRLPLPQRGRPRESLPLTPLHFSSGGSALSDLTFRGLHLTTPKSHFKNLTSLDTLSLDNVKITETTLRRITGDLPLLRRLDIRRCPSLKRATILAPNIAAIVIVACPNLSELNVFARTLRSLHFSSGILKTYTVYNVAALEDLYLSCGDPGISGHMDSNWVSALGPLSAVRVLTLCNMSLQYIAVSGGRANGVVFRVLESLKELQLLMMMMADSNLMDIFSFFHLCRCPGLEKLFIQLPAHMRDASMQIFLAEAEVEPPENCFQHLKMIKISNFNGHKNEIRLIRFLLSTAALLETLVIVVPLHRIRDEYSQRIVFYTMMRYLDLQFASMTKASANLRIIVYGRDNNKVRPTHDAGYCNI